MRAQIQKRQLLPGVFSASAMERIEHFWYIIGDDASEMYRLDNAFQIGGSIPLVQTISSHNTPAPKAEKLDLEAMTRVTWRGRSELLAFGSGSKTRTRDFCFRVDVTDANAPRLLAQISLTALYEVLRATPEFVGTQQLNLEAAAAAANELFLFQRGNISGNNAMAAYDLNAFMAYLDEPTQSAPQPRVARFSLPVLQNRNAGFSAAVAADDSRIFFAASVEDTDNEIDDGATLGSFIGLLVRNRDWRIAWMAPVYAGDEIAPVKIEGLAHISSALESCQFFAVTDADGESSEMLKIEIT